MEIPECLLLKVDEKEVQAILPQLQRLWDGELKAAPRTQKDDKPKGKVELLALYRANDELQREWLDNHGISIACKSGCQECCYQGLICRQIEAEIIIDWLNRRNKVRRQIVPQMIERLACQMVDFKAAGLVNVDSPGAILASINLTAGRPCPLLFDDGLCAVYPVRPLICRTSKSTESCWFEDGHLHGKNTDICVDAAAFRLADDLQAGLNGIKVQGKLLIQLLSGWLVCLMYTIKPID